jgi:hypothetical protein
MKRFMAGSTVASVCAVCLSLGAAVSPAGARARSAPAKPSIRITGISVDMFNAQPGSKITYHPNNPPNACYDIGGADQDPPQVDVVFFIHAVGIPNNAPTTLDVVTPWDTQSRPDSTDAHPTFAKTWFRNKGHGVASIFGGSDAPGNFYTFDDEGTRGNVFNGTYVVTTTVKVHGQVLHARATLKVDCVV